MITVLGPGLPPRLLPCQFGRDFLPTEQVLVAKRCSNGRQTRLMIQQVADRNHAFTRLGEFGPVLRDRSLEVELTLIGQPMRAHRAKPLGGGPDVDDRVTLPCARLSLIGMSRPQIDRAVPVNHH